MGFVVVRCPGCRGAARVGPEAVGLLVVCPRCSDPFLAVEEAGPPARTPDRPRPRDPDPGRPRRARTRAEPVAPGGPGAPLVVDPHDPHAVEVGGLPLSVMVGLALLPFAIPLVWLIAPLVAGRAPALSVATPAALAVAFAALCLAVVFTVDWSPSTRLKGVVLLLGLAYFAGLGLFFLRKEMVDKAGAVFGPRWQEFRPPDGAYRVELPHRPFPVNERPLGNLAAPLTLHRAARPVWGGVFTCTVGAGTDTQEKLADDAWFATAERALFPGQNAAPAGRPVAPGGANVPGREWRVEQPGLVARTVQVYRDRANGVVYYLAADDADDPALARRFFESFRPLK